MSKATLFVDAETYLFKAAAGATYEVSFDWDDWHHWTELATAKRVFRDTIAQLKEQSGASDMVLAFGHKTNFRYGVLPSYKRKRRVLRRPAGYKELMRWAIEEHESLQLPGCEGDDVVGILAGYEDVITSGDKDLSTIPGHHLKDGEVVETSHHAADRFHMLQTLTGDETDGYSGCPKIGKVNAARILEGAADTWDMWLRVLEAYAKAGLLEKDAMVNAQVARILRRHEYDLVTMVPRLWRPPLPPVGCPAEA